MKKELGIFVLLTVLCGVTAAINPRFVSGTNLTNMANIIGLFGIFSIGLGLIIITGGIDLSVGSMFALCGVLLSMALTEWSWAWRSWDLSAAQIRNEQVLVEKLRDSKDSLSKYIWSQLSEELRNEISRSDSIQREKLTKDLNRILHGDSIYDAERFEDVAFSSLTQKLLKTDSPSRSHLRVNRLLLEDAYPNVFLKAHQYWPWFLAALLAVVIPMVLGWAHGLLITRVNIQPFIVTLCGLLLYRGLARFIADDNTKGFGNAQGFEMLRDLAKGKLLGIPMPFVILIVVGVVMWFVLHRSVFGRYLLAVGRNEEAARFSGINTRLVIASSYIVAGVLTGISGVLFAFYTNSISPSNHGNFFELYGIAAAVLGGCSLRGGEGSIIGIIIGTALLQVLQNLVNLLGIPSSLNFAVMGAVVLIGVLADQLIRKRSERSLVRH